MKRSHSLPFIGFVLVFVFNFSFAQRQGESPFPLTPEEETSLLYFREAERMAHDLYTLFDEDERWDLLIFYNISQSESAHTGAVLSKLEKYGLPDPALDFGVFEEPFATLFADLANRGIDSAETVMDPLLAGAYVEELSIQQLGEALATTTTRDIAILYEHLQRGSRNHLRAFVSHYELQGLEYPYQGILTQEEVNAIVDSPMERGPQSLSPRDRPGPWFRSNGSSDPNGQGGGSFRQGPNHRGDSTGGDGTGTGSGGLNLRGNGDNGGQGGNGDNGGQGGNGGGNGGQGGNGGGNGGSGGSGGGGGNGGSGGSGGGGGH